MTAQPSDNVRPIRALTPAQEALSEALNRPEKGQLDVFLKMEAAKHPDPQEEAWEALIASGDAVALTDATFPHGILHRLQQVIAERDQARRIAHALDVQIETARHEIRPYLRWRGLTGEVARLAESALHPLDEPPTSPAA